MKRLIAAIFSLFLALGLPAGALAEEKESLAPLAAWAGKYPYDEIAGKDLLATNLFSQHLKALLGQKKFDVFEKEFWQGVTFPVQKKDDVVLFHFCKAHECMDYMIYIYANLKDDSLQACWMRRNEVQGYWLWDKEKAQDIGAAGCLDDLPFGLYEKHKK